jgi:hypothetical protein
VRRSTEREKSEQPCFLCIYKEKNNRYTLLQVLSAMDQEIKQPIDVVVVFQKGQMVPVRFRWNGRIVKIARVTGRWRANEGRFKIRYFAVIDGDSQFCQLSYKERTGEWFLEKIWVE